MKTKLWMAGCFWALFIVPNLIWAFISPLMEEKNTENRVLAEFPKIHREDFQNYPKEIEDFINDHAAFRSQFLSLNAVINLALFQSVDNSSVIRGKDGWYFYGNAAGIRDYRGLNLYTEEELTALVAKFQETQQRFANQGITFAVILAPNKEEIYSEYMPSCYTRFSAFTRYDQLTQCLRDLTDIPLAAPKQYFLENRDLLWYYKTDTHWNEAGAFVTGQMLIEALGGIPVSTEKVIIPYDFRDAGDLANLAHMPDRFIEDYFCIVRGYYEDVQFSTEFPFADVPVSRTWAEAAPDSRRIALYHDSFAMLMTEKLSRYFQEATYIPWQSYQPEYLRANLPDILIYEIVERDFFRLTEDMDRMMQALP